MRGSRLLVLLLAFAPAVASAETTATQAVTDAITRAVRARVGAEANVSITGVSGLRLATAATTLLAVPDPASKPGAAMRFLLSDASAGKAPVRVGEATAWVSVTVPAVKVVRPVARGEVLTDADVEQIEASLDGRRLRPLPQLESAIGARATRDLREATVLAPGDLAPEPLVHSGDVVRTHARFADVEVIGVMVASESGNANEIIRVMNQETKRSVRARIVARGEVEVVNVR